MVANWLYRLINMEEKYIRTLQEICQLVTSSIGHWKVIVFHLWPFCDQKHKVKSWGSLIDYSDLLRENVVDVYDQNRKSLNLWPFVLVTSWLPRPRRIRRGNLTWKNYDQFKRSLTRFSPVRLGVLDGPSPTIQPFIYIFPIILVSYMGQAQHYSLFIFGL